MSSFSRITKKIIFSPNAPKPVGPYSQAVQVGHTVYVSGVLGLEPASGALAPGGAPAQAAQALKNLAAILEEANSSYDQVVKSTIFLDDIKDFGDVNEVYKTCFKEPFPARSTFQVGKLPLGAKVEIEVIALSSSDK